MKDPPCPPPLACSRRDPAGGPGLGTGPRWRGRSTATPPAGSGGQLGHRVLPPGLLAGVTGAVDLGEGDATLGVEEEGAADGHAGAVVEDAVGLGDGAVRPEVRQQREVETLLFV